MSKFLFFTDGHLSGINSVSQIGNYYSDWMEQFKELISIYKKEKCSYLLDGGDLLHSENMSNTIIDDFLDLIEENDINYMGLFGNHALHYGNFKASKGTSFYHMVKRSKNFNYLTTLKNDKEKWVIESIEYSYGIEEKLKETHMDFSKEYNNYFKIVIAHVFICEKEFPYASHIVYKDINTNANLFLCGHYHQPWEKLYHDTQFVNPGSFGRRSIAEKDIQPSCLLIDTEKRSWEKIPLKSAKPPEECFDLSKVAEEKEADKNIDAFLEKVENFNFQSIDFRDKIKEYAKVTNEDNEVVTNIIERLTKVEKTNA